MFRSLCKLSSFFFVLSLPFLTGCGPDSTPANEEAAPVSLLSEWAQVRVDNSQPAPELPAQAEIRFDGGGVSGVTWEVVSGVTGLEVRDGLLVGRTTAEPTAIRFKTAEPLGGDDELWAVEMHLQVTEGERVAIMPLLPEGGPPVGFFLSGLFADWPLSSLLLPGEGVKKYTVRMDQVMTLDLPMAKSNISDFILRPSKAAGAEFAIESIRFVFRKEHFATIPSGPGWQGLGDVYRETLVSRVPETLAFQVDLPARPWLDLAVGTMSRNTPAFSVSVVPEGGAAETAAELRLDESDVWQASRIDLSPWAGQSVELRLEATGEEGALALWGGPTVRNSLTTPTGEHPQAVVLYLADTLRADHLEAWGYGRDTAPTLRRLVAEGVQFKDTIAQSTWTKGSVPSILSSLYPSTSGVINHNDRIPAGETTLSEIFRDAGYATFATSSIPFTGQLSNLHQGVEVMYEFGSNEEEDGEYRSKTSTHWVDLYLEWLDRHRDVPTFAIVHVMDPHSPYLPPAPYDTLWATPEDADKYAEQAEKLKPHIANPMLQRFVMPTREEMQAAGVDEESFLSYEKAWYDGSIRHLDDNLGRILDGFEQHGLKEDALLAVISDHGEEFLEHGQHWHGLTVYGEMANVPMVFWGRGVPQGVVVEDTVQALDLLPTMAEFAGLEVPPRAQGRSLVPLVDLEGGGEAAAKRLPPAFTERPLREGLDGPGTYASYSVVEGGFKLIWNLEPPDSVPEFELYDHVKDRLNQQDIAADHPEVVERLAARLRDWRAWAEEQRLDEASSQADLSAEELEQLRSLGYID